MYSYQDMRLDQADMARDMKKEEASEHLFYQLADIPLYKAKDLIQGPPAMREGAISARGIFKVERVYSAKSVDKISKYRKQGSQEFLT